MHQLDVLVLKRFASIPRRRLCRERGLHRLSIRVPGPCARQS
eukprot:COSAG01_NODE_28515_length_659_cov_1.221429_2_plen_41_part_01